MPQMNDAELLLKVILKNYTSGNDGVKFRYDAYEDGIYKPIIDYFTNKGFMEFFNNKKMARFLPEYL